MNKKNPKADLRSYHTIFTQTGIIIALLFLIAATKVDIQSEKKGCICTPEFEPPMIIDLPPEIPPENPPAPLKPFVPIEKPDNAPIDDDPIDFPEFDLTDMYEMLPPPSDEKVDIYEPFMIEVHPAMSGGTEAFYKLLNYPKRAQDAGIEGRVSVKFVVNEKGEVENPEIVRGIGGGCDEEVLRVIKLMKFTPGIQNGTFVKVKMHQTVNFRLNN